MVREEINGYMDDAVMTNVTLKENAYEGASPLFTIPRKTIGA